MPRSHDAPVQPRLGYVDALRAFAAIAVAVFHFHHELRVLPAVLPEPLDVVLAHGYLGVNVFFVLSGFVIAWSLREARYSAGFVGRFALRRSLRLDPPYWVTIPMAAVVVANRANDPIRVTAPAILAHVFYLQGILGFRSFLDVFWTLCIEIQLYLFFCLMGWLAQTLERLTSRSWRRDLLGATTLVSLVLPFVIPESQWNKWFVVYWYQFALGVWACWSVSERRAQLWMAIAVAGALGLALRLGDAGPAVCVATACALAAAQASPRGAYRGMSVLATLGRRSYSFYLLHALVGVGFLRRWNDHLSASVTYDVLGLGLAFALAFAAAELLFRLVERPSMAFSRRIQLRPTPVAAPMPAATALTPNQ